MESEMKELLDGLGLSLEKIHAAASALDASAARLKAMGHSNEWHPDVALTAPVANVEVGKITASIEGAERLPLETPPGDAGERQESMLVADLEQRLKRAEHTLASLQAGLEQAIKTSPVSTRKTLPTATLQLLAKQGIASDEAMDIESLDAALAGLSVEQRIAVKSQMMRSGALTL